jgi:predicted NBD/HSP70 family sugar kinase
MLSQPIASVTRQLSRRSVFEALLHRSPISRAVLPKVTGLSKQTMSEVIDAFEHDLGAQRMTVALADITGRVLAEADEPTDSRGGAWVLDQIALLSERLARDTHTHPSRIRSLVLALLDLGLIVLGGSIGVRPGIYDRFRRALPRLFSRPITIAPSQLGDRAGLIGAVCAATQAMRQGARA